MGVSRLLTPADLSLNFRVANSSSIKPIKRIAVTSSTVSVGLAPRAGRQYTAEEWSETAVAEVKGRGKQASGFSKYCTSKTLVERGMSGSYLYLPVLMSAPQAAWKVCNGNRGSIGWDTTTLNPPYVSYPSGIVHSSRLIFLHRCLGYVPSCDLRHPCSDEPALFSPCCKRSESQKFSIPRLLSGLGRSGMTARMRKRSLPA